MPNWCTNYLSIKVPTAKRDALLAALEGPDDWVVPNTEATCYTPPSECSAHAELAFQALAEGMGADNVAQREALIAAFQAHEQAAYGRPSWMPVSRYELRAFFAATTSQKPYNSPFSSTALSIAQIAPWKDREEFDRFFPGTINDQGLWSPIPEPKNTTWGKSDTGYRGLHDERMGVKWTPSDVHLHDHEEDEHGNTIVLFSFNTPWGPMETFHTLFENLLREHQAEAILVWTEEDQNSGWFYNHPAKDQAEDDTFEHGEHRIPVDTDNEDDDETEDEDEDGYIDTEWDYESLLDSVSCQIDATFHPRLP